MSLSRSHTKSGPGRYHGDGRMFVQPFSQGRSEPKRPVRRFPIASQGGNWKGLEYVSYREHDRVFTLMAHGLTRPDAIKAMRAERRAA